MSCLLNDPALSMSVLFKDFVSSLTSNLIVPPTLMPLNWKQNLDSNE